MKARGRADAGDILLQRRDEPRPLRWRRGQGGRRATVPGVERLAQPPDHPILLSTPERCLTGLIVELG